MLLVFFGALRLCAMMRRLFGALIVFIIRQLRQLFAFVGNNADLHYCRWQDDDEDSGYEEAIAVVYQSGIS